MHAPSQQLLFPKIKLAFRRSSPWLAPGSTTICFSWRIFDVFPRLLLVQKARLPPSSPERRWRLCSPGG